MPRDSFDRQINYLRISVIDNCNLRCVYCMPLQGLQFLPKPELLTAEEIERVVRGALDAGFTKFRLTGGEPTLRADLLEIVERLASLGGVGDLALTTNALLLPKLARPLKDAGLTRINVHLDSLNPDTVERQMRWGSFERIWEGIMAAEEAGLTPIQLNAGVTPGGNQMGVGGPARLGFKREMHGAVLEFVRLAGAE